jgi:indolepyruvate ferredoxin oxidoreductase beta subunit
VLDGVLAAPVAAPDLRALARQRLADYQDPAYARPVRRAPGAHRGWRSGRPTRARRTQAEVRWLALWMAFDDIVRVAAAKLAASRQARVRREVGAGDDDCWSSLRPLQARRARVRRAAAAGPGQRLQAWDRRRVAAGREPWALPLKLGTHTVLGTLALRWWRR